MRLFLKTVALISVLCPIAMAGPAGPPAGNPILNSAIYQRNSVMNIDTATARQVTFSTFTNAPSLPVGVTIAGALYNSAGADIPSFRSEYDVQDFGVKCDGSDETTALQNAINIVQAIHGTLTIPARACWAPHGLSMNQTMRLAGKGAMVEDDTNQYFIKTGLPNQHSGYSIIYTSSQNVDGLTITQSSLTVTYAMNYGMQPAVENIMFIGPGQSSGTSGSGIVVRSNDLNNSLRPYFRNVSVTDYGGYGIDLRQGYYGGAFYFVNTNNNGLTGFHAKGTSQGEWGVFGIRAIGNGTQGLTQEDQAGIYVSGGGANVNFFQVTSSYNYKIQFMFNGSTGRVFGLHDEGSGTGDSAQREILIKSSHFDLYGADFGSFAGYLGRIIDVEGTSYGNYLGLSFNHTVDATGFHVWEDTATTAGNTYSYNSNADSIKSLVSGTSLIGRGTEIRYNQAIAGNFQRQEVLFQYVKSGSLCKVRWYDNLNFGSAANSNFSNGFNSISNTFTTISSGTDSSNAFANAAKISSATTNRMILETADLNGAEARSPMIGVVSYSDGVVISSSNAVIGSTFTVNSTVPTIPTVRVVSASVNVNGTTRTRICLDFYLPDGTAYILGSLPEGKSIYVSLHGWLPQYQ